MKREIFKFIEGIPASAGYSNYEFFQEGTLVYIDTDLSWKGCFLCDEEGTTILDEEGNEIFLDWCVGDSDYPIWEDKLEPYKEVDIEFGEDYSHIMITEISKESLLSILHQLPDNTVMYLDTDGSLAEKYTKEYGSDCVGLLLKKNDVNVITVSPPQKEIKIPDINDLFDSLDDIEHLTVNFHKYD